MPRPLRQSSGSGSEDEDGYVHRTAAARVVPTAADSELGSDASDSSEWDSDDGGSSMPYIVDVAAVSSSLARSMSDKGVQQTQSAKLALMSQQQQQTSVQRQQATGETNEWADEADEEAAIVADEDSTSALSATSSRLMVGAVTRPSTATAFCASSPHLSTSHSGPDWPCLPPLPLSLSRPTTAAAAISGGLTCRAATIRASTASTPRSARPATASSSTAAATTTASTASLSSTGPPSPSSLASLQLPADCAGASSLTTSQQAIIRGSFLSAARERRKMHKQQQQQAEQSGLVAASSMESKEQLAFVSHGAVDASRASTAPSSASLSLSSSLHSASIPSSPSSFRISPRSPESPISSAVRSRAASSCFASQPTASALAACVFPIKPQVSRQPAMRRTARTARTLHQQR